MPPPSPGTGGNVLTGVALVSACDAWAVGSASDGTSTHASTLLLGVAATSARNAWAAGITQTSTTEQGLILRWNGTAWTQISAPSPGTVTALSAVAATSATNAWAVGRFSSTIVDQALAIHCC